MKHLISLAAVVCAFTLNAATFYDLKPGLNDIQSAGEIVALECNTIAASQSVTAAVVTAVTEYTNAYKTVTTPHTRYDFTITNYDGRAAIATNTLDTFSYADWMRGTTNLIVGAVKPVRTNISERVVSGSLPKATYTHEAAIGNGSASSHYLKITPASTMYFIGGKIKLQCAEGDLVRILVK